MNWQRVHPQEVAAQPWSNGGGLTRQLLAWPDAGDWAVRVSLAQVAQHGDFSSYPGVRRWLAVVSGQGLQLNAGGAPQKLTRLSSPFEFDGGAPTRCQLLDGATEVLNLMVRGGFAHTHRVRGTWAASCKPGKLLVAYAGNTGATIIDVTGRLEMSPHTLAWRLLDLEGLVELIANDALWMEIEP